MSQMNSPIEDDEECLTRHEDDVANILADSEKLPSPNKSRLQFALFLIFFSNSLSGIIFQDQVLYQACTSVFNYNESICKQIGADGNDTQANETNETNYVEDIVQTYASKIFMADSLIQGIFPAFIVLFLGSWSDKFGRKPAILSSCVGYICFHITRTIIATVSIYYSFDPWFYIIASIPLSLSGGPCLLFSALYCYIVDITHLKERPYVICLLGGISALGVMLGHFLSTYIYQASNASVVFATSTASQLFVILFVIFFIEESVKAEQLVQTSKLRGLFDIQLFKDMIATAFSRREHFDRAIIWCIILTLTAAAFDGAGAGNVAFLFVRNRLDWTVQNFNSFIAITIVIHFIGATAGIVILQRWLCVKSTTMTLIAIASAIVYSAFCTIATESCYLYVGASLSFLSGVGNPMCQSMLSNIVPPNEIGKVFALNTALQSISPLVAIPMYTVVYNSTLTTYPGAFFLISILLSSASFLLIGFVHIVELYYPNVNRPKIS